MWVKNIITNTTNWRLVDSRSFPNAHPLTPETGGPLPAPSLLSFPITYCQLLTAYYFYYEQLTINLITLSLKAHSSRLKATHTTKLIIFPFTKINFFGVEPFVHFLMFS